MSKRLSNLATNEYYFYGMESLFLQKYVTIFQTVDSAVKPERHNFDTVVGLFGLWTANTEGFYHPTFISKDC